MKIWLVNHYASSPASGFGGTRHFSLAKELLARGHDVRVIASGFNHRTRKDIVEYGGEDWRMRTEEGVPFVWIRTPPYSNALSRVRNMLAFGNGVKKYARRNTGNLPDVIFGSSVHLFCPDACRQISEWYGLPFCLEIRDLWPQTLIDLKIAPSYHPFAIWLGLIEKRLYKCAGKIVTVLPNAAEHIASKGGNRSKIVYIPNGVDLSLVPAPVRPTESDRQVFMYAGAHGVPNALDIYAPVAEQLQARMGDSIQLQFFGEGSEKARLIRETQSKSLSNVSFFNAIPKRDIYQKLIQAAAYFVNIADSPLYRYGISLNKLFDYMALARPTIVGTTAFNNPIKESNAGITVNPDDVNGTAEAFMRIARMPADERWKLGMNGRSYVEEHHDYRRLGRKLEETLASIVRL